MVGHWLDTMLLRPCSDGCGKGYFSEEKLRGGYILRSSDRYHFTRSYATAYDQQGPRLQPENPSLVVQSMLRNWAYHLTVR